jgi:hypothetical protein
MAGLCVSGLAALAGVLGVFGMCWYRGKQNERKQKKASPEKEENTNELIV